MVLIGCQGQNGVDWRKSAGYEVRGTTAVLKSVQDAIPGCSQRSLGNRQTPPRAPKSVSPRLRFGLIVVRPSPLTAPLPWGAARARPDMHCNPSTYIPRTWACTPESDGHSVLCIALALQHIKRTASASTKISTIHVGMATRPVFASSCASVTRTR